MRHIPSGIPRLDTTKNLPNIMKTPLLLVGFFFGFVSVCFANTPGIFSRVTITVSRTTVDLDKSEENKTEAEHILAMENNQNSTWITKAGVRTLRIGNRQVLEYVLADLKGWSLGYVESELFTGFVAYKKGETSVAIPDAVLAFGGETAGNEVARNVSRYVAATTTRTETSSSSYRKAIFGFVLTDYSLAGVERGQRRTRYVTNGLIGTYTESEVRRFTLAGGLGDAVFEGKAVLNGKHLHDVSAYLPPLF